jgi:hypothetical protein
MRRVSVSPRFVMLVALFGCAAPMRLQIPTESHVAVAGTEDAAGSATDSITVQVRSFSYSPTVSVLAWNDKEPDYGMRAQLRSDGTLVGDHIIYVSAYYRPDMPQSPRATIPTRRLDAWSGARDDFACYFGECSPQFTLGAAIPDHVLRELRDDIPVRFFEHPAARRQHPLLPSPEIPRAPREITITMNSALVAAYLTTVDSVSAELRKR